MLKVGITGGIGSGKSLVSSIFNLIGTPVYDSDQRAKDIMHDDEDVRLQITQIFGHKAYDSEGNLNRSYISSRVFSDKDLLAKLNAAVHPAVAEDYERWCHIHFNKPYTLKEAALIFETGIYKSLDKVVLVFAPEELRISRVMERDNTNEQTVKARIDNQWHDNKKAPLADYVIINDGEQPLLRQVLEIHNLLIDGAENHAK